MRQKLWVAALLVSLAAAESTGVRANCVGGTLESPRGNTSGRLDITGGEGLAFQYGSAVLRIPYTRVHTLEYGQRVNRRYAAAIIISPLLLLSKSRKHFLTIGYTDTDGQQQALVFRLGKGDVRSILAGLEARTGRRVEFQDEEARKAGKG